MSASSVKRPAFHAHFTAPATRGTPGGPLSSRTFAIGDVHGSLSALLALFADLPTLTADDTLVFLGDYVDRGPDSAGVLRFVREELPARTPARIVTLRGNHEDAWLRVMELGWPEFIIPPGNGCLACLRSYHPSEGPMSNDELSRMFTGSFFPLDVVAWMRKLPWWYEDDHAIYVHAGLVEQGSGWLHPSEVEDPIAMVWTRSQRFFRDYRGKRVVVGHTATRLLPVELSSYTPEDPTDLWAGEAVVAIDTGAGKPGGFLTALELPAGRVYESR